jgi:hypothetical protein
LPPSARVAAVLVVTVLVLGGCAADVTVTPPSVGPDARATCTRVVDALPDTVSDQPSRATEPTSPLTAAWGEPAIVLQCGVGQPAAYRPTAELITVNGVDWFPEEFTEGYVFTTRGRAVNVEVAVPDEYAPEVNPLVDLAPAIKRANPTTR